MIPVKEGKITRASIFALTPAEIAILVELCRDGADSAVIGKRLHLSARTVRTHFSAIFAKLGCNNRTGAIIAILRDHELRPVCFPWLSNEIVRDTMRSALANQLQQRVDECIDEVMAKSGYETHPHDQRGRGERPHPLAT